MKLLHRYWFEFDYRPDQHHVSGVGYGVTGYSREDALALLLAAVPALDPLPPIAKEMVDFDPSQIDVRHVPPNMGVPVRRGVWYPNLWNHPSVHRDRSVP
jgi:hypothetical protein